MIGGRPVSEPIQLFSRMDTSPAVNAPGGMALSPISPKMSNPCCCTSAWNSFPRLDVCWNQNP